VQSKVLFIMIVAMMANGCLGFVWKKSVTSGITPGTFAIFLGVGLIIFGIGYHLFTNSNFNDLKNVGGSLAFSKPIILYLVASMIGWIIACYSFSFLYGTQPMSFVYPVISIGTILLMVMFGYLFLSENMPWTKVTGILLGIASIVLLNVSKATQ